MAGTVTFEYDYKSKTLLPVCRQTPGAVILFCNCDGNWSKGEHEKNR
jgi:hypothetical protein